MATYTTNFSSWSDFEDRIAAFQDYEDSYAYQAVQNVAADLTYDLFFADPYSYTFSATSITAYYYGATAHLYGSNFGTASATVTRADITNGTYTLVLKGSVNVGGVNPTGTITSLDLSGGGYSEHAVGQIPLSGLNGVFNSWSNTYPHRPGKPDACRHRNAHRVFLRQHDNDLLGHLPCRRRRKYDLAIRPEIHHLG
jgi:hypothetical protein